MKLNVAYSCDDNYTQHTGISLISLLENNKVFDEIEVFLIAKGISSANMNSLASICQNYNRKFTTIPFETLCHDLKVGDSERHTETIYAKLFFSRISEVEKILYIDSDTVVIDSLLDLWSIDLGENLFAGVNARVLNPPTVLGLPEQAPFINDGVVMVNVEACRKSNFLEKCVDFIDANDGSPPLLTEGIINKLCLERIHVLHPRYNLMSGLMEYRESRFFNQFFYSSKIVTDAIKRPAIIHYLSAFYNRPWDVNCTHPLKDHYLHFKALSRWKNVPLTNRKLRLRLSVIKFLLDVLPRDVFNVIRAVKNIKF